MGQVRQKNGLGFLDVAKSQIVLFLGKTCELCLLFGTLWITITLTNKEAITWFGGSLNTIVLTTMGVGVDAAMPESFLHAVAQRIEDKKEQFPWSITIAVAMFLLVIVNIISAAVDNETGVFLPQGAIITLLIIRCVVGISYVTIREAQTFIDKHAHEQQQAVPQIPVADIQRIIFQAFSNQADQYDIRLTSLAARLETRFVEATKDQQRMIANFGQCQEQRLNLLDMNQQSALTSLKEAQEIALTAPHLKAIVETIMAQLETAMRQVGVSPAHQTRQLEMRNTRTSHEQGVSSNVVLLPPKASQVSHETARIRVGKVAEFAHDKAAFVLLERNGNLTASELSELLGVSRATAGRIKQRYANTSCETVPYRDEICGDETNAGETSQESAS